MKFRVNGLLPYVSLSLLGLIVNCSSDDTSSGSETTGATTGGATTGSSTGGASSSDGGTGGSGSGSAGTTGGAIPDASVDDASSDGGADAMVVCEAGAQKVCNDNCVQVDDPNYGCTPSDCTACNIMNAVSACTAGQCTLSHCQDGFANLDGDDTNGCETQTPLNIESMHLRVWLRADEGVHADSNGLVGTWDDQAPPGEAGVTHNATQNTTSAKPTLVASGWDTNPALPYLDFSGANELTIDLGFLAGSDYTILFVSGRGTGKANNDVLGTGEATGDAGIAPNGALTLGYPSSTEFVFGQSSNDISVVVPALQAGPDGGSLIDQAVWTASFAQAGSTPGKLLYLGGTLKKADPDQIAPLTPAGGDNGAIGRSFSAPNTDTHFVGRIGEILIYDEQLPVDARTKVESYLKMKWKTNL